MLANRSLLALVVGFIALFSLTLLASAEQGGDKKVEQKKEKKKARPNPVYTDEARSLKLEGEVLLEVSFSATSSLHVNRVVRGLGHGLDEAAIAAANKIRFKPALRNGQPMDSTAVVHVTFQLAY